MALFSALGTIGGFQGVSLLPERGVPKPEKGRGPMCYDKNPLEV